MALSRWVHEANSEDMTHEVPASLSILEPHECWSLIRTATVGRLAVAVDGAPDIFPVNYVVDHGAIVFRTAEGTKLAAVALASAVAFEVDGWDADSGNVWSVVIKGRGQQLQGTDQLIDAATLPLFPWHGARKERFIQVVADQITGRRFHRVDPEVWRTPLTDARRTAPD